MSLRDKVYALRAEYRDSRIFFINNPSIKDKQYFGVFDDQTGQLHYDFADSTSSLVSMRNERIKTGTCTKYKILYKQQFINFWFDYEFWLYCQTFAVTEAETKHYEHKIELLKEKLQFL